jgi:hypothetical protein
MQTIHIVPRAHAVVAKRSQRFNCPCILAYQSAVYQDMMNQHTEITMPLRKDKKNVLTSGKRLSSKRATLTVFRHVRSSGRDSDNVAFKIVPSGRIIARLGGL